MASIRTLAMQYIGRPVVVHSHYGVHYGVLHHCDDNGLYLVQSRVGLASTEDLETNGVPLCDIPTDNQINQVFFPFFFLPWLALAAIGPWGYWW